MKTCTEKILGLTYFVSHTHAQEISGKTYSAENDFKLSREQEDGYGNMRENKQIKTWTHGQKSRTYFVDWEIKAKYKVLIQR